jgi:hypothetical protein
MSKTVNETFGFETKRMNLFEAERVKKVPKKLYHFTLDTNLESIFNSRKLKADDWGYVYFTETLEDCAKFIRVYAELNGISVSDYSIIEIDVNSIKNWFNKKYLYVSHDHNPEHFDNAEAVMYNDNLKIGASAKVIKINEEVN